MQDTLERIISITSIVVLCILCVASVSASAATQLTNSQGGVYFTGTSADPGTLYQDAIGGNIDVGMRLCGYGQRYVGGAYAINVSGTFYSSLVSYQSSSLALSYTDAASGAGCFAVTPGFFTLSPSQLATPDPDVFKAAFPGRLWTAIDISANPGPLTVFAAGGNDSYLRGNYTATRAFNYSSRDVTVQTPTIIFQTTADNISKLASDAQFGIASDKPFTAGLCDDDHGALCSDGGIYTVSPFPIDYDTGLVPAQVDDQQTHTKYVVFNGIGLPMCIGANLQMSVTGISPSPSYYSQNLTVSTLITNYRDEPTDLLGGNVPVTTPFTVRITVQNLTNVTVVNTTYTITPSLEPGESMPYSILFNAPWHSGTYLVTITLDINNTIAECNETDNIATHSFYLYNIVLPRVQIDGVNSTIFPYPGVPYWMNFSLINSDNDTLSNATVQLVEINGLSVNSGTQAYNVTSGNSTSGRSGVRSTSVAEFFTNHEGNVSITYVPTHNQLYDSQYSYLQLSQHIGTARRYMAGQLSNGSDFIFIVNNTVTTDYPFTLNSTSFNATVMPKSILNNATIAQTMDNIYRVFANYLRALGI